MSSHHDHNPNDIHVPHILPMKVYVLVTIGLFALTILTVATGKIEHLINFDLGQPWNIIIALVIACTKVFLVAFFFMHLYYESAFMRITFFSGLFFLGLFFLFVLIDTETRHKEAKPAEVQVIQALEGYNADGTPKKVIKH